ATLRARAGIARARTATFSLLPRGRPMRGGHLALHPHPPGRACRAREEGMETGATAWLLMSTPLFMIMLPGLALFYGGLVRRKNVLSTIMHSFFGLALVSVVWVVLRFTLSL